MNRAAHRTYLVAKSPDGRWSVTGPGAASGMAYSSKDAAEKAARSIAREGGGVITVVNAKGGTGKSFTLGRSAMTKLNQVEGVVLGRAGKKVFAAFDKVDATPAQRRATLKSELAKLATGTKGPASRSDGVHKRSGPRG